MIGNKKMAEIKTTTRNLEKRVPFGTPRTKLSVSIQPEGFHLRWINDSPGRISQAQEGGYSFVEPKEVGKEDTPNGKVFELVGTNKDNTPLHAYLMKIPQEWYLEDTKSKQSFLDDIDSAIRGGRGDSESKQGRYIPTAGISLK